MRSRTMLLWLSALPLVIGLVPIEAAQAVFQRETIAEEVGAWGKGFLDVDGDGRLDVLAAGGELDGTVQWYRAPDWSLFLIGNQGGGDDLATHDMNGDGVKDVVVNRNPIGWYENPRGRGGDPTQAWTLHVIEASARSHDLLVHDFDDDQRPDVSVREAGGSTRIYFQEADGSFTRVILAASLEAEGGHAHADIDGDGRLDVIGPGYWLRHPADPRDGDAWNRFPIDPGWPAGGAVAADDFDGDGNLDVVLAPSETGSGTITWYEAPDDPSTQSWVPHAILEAQDVHRIHLVDFDQDGDRDIAFAEMHQSPLDRVGVIHNEGSGSSWTLELLSTLGSHNIAVADVEGDGDIDLLGANWNISNAPDRARLDLWRNDRNFAGRADLDAWHPMRIDDAKPDRAFGLAFGDLDRDGRIDVATGRSWYRNPGSLPADDWAAVDLGPGLDAMLILDVDDDGRLDLVAQGEPGSGQVPIVWLIPNDEQATSFTPIPIGQIPADPSDGRGQGALVTSLLGPGSRDLVFSSDGVHVLTIPANPRTDPWPSTILTEQAREEGIAVADLDRDSDLDLVAIVAPAGTTIAWWENEGGGSFTRHDLGSTSGIEADRIAIADIDWDGRLDVVVSETNLAGTGNSLYWFAQPLDPTAPNWLRTPIASGLGSLNSMDVADLDGDGRPDVITGEHRGDLDIVVWQNVDGGATWTAHTVAEGRESHLGTRLVDLDGDGARDVVSIGFDEPEFVRAWTVEVIPEPGPRSSAVAAFLTTAAVVRVRSRRRPFQGP